MRRSLCAWVWTYLSRVLLSLPNGRNGNSWLTWLVKGLGFSLFCTTLFTQSRATAWNWNCWSYTRSGWKYGQNAGCWWSTCMHTAWPLAWVPQTWGSVFLGENPCQLLILHPFLCIWNRMECLLRTLNCSCGFAYINTAFTHSTESWRKHKSQTLCFCFLKFLTLKFLKWKLRFA